MLKGSWAWLQASTVAGGRHSVVTDYVLRLLVSLLLRLLLRLLVSLCW